MTEHIMNGRFISPQFPRASEYNPDWIMAGISGGANALWLAEWLAQSLDLQPNMRVLDLGCGRALSSIFFHREFGVQVWATDLWFSPTENLQRIRDGGVEGGVFPIRADARSLPFPAEFFDAIVSIDSFPYYGTDELYLSSLVRHVKPGGHVGIAGAGLVQEIEGPVPDHLQGWGSQELRGLHTAGWWRRHWEQAEIMDMELADTLPGGWQLWREWQLAVAPGNLPEIQAVEADRGRYLGYIRVVGRRRAGIQLEQPIVLVATEYAKKSLLRKDQA